MSTYERREITIQRVEWTVPAPAPWGAPWADVTKAIGAAHQELVGLGQLAPGAEAADDAITVYPTDEGVVVTVETRTTTALPA